MKWCCFVFNHSLASQLFFLESNDWMKMTYNKNLTVFFCVDIADVAAYCSLYVCICILFCLMPMSKFKVVGPYQASQTEFIFSRLLLIKCSCPNVSLSGERAAEGRTHPALHAVQPSAGKTDNGSVLPQPLGRENSRLWPGHGALLDQHTCTATLFLLGHVNRREIR